MAILWRIIILIGFVFSVVTAEWQDWQVFVVLALLWIADDLDTIKRKWK